MPKIFESEHMHTYLKGYFAGKNWPYALRALEAARQAHAGQNRKDGQPYIVHPLTIACHAVTLGIDDEDLLCAALLHDVVEDCGVKLNNLPVRPEARDLVRRMTHIKTTPLDVYYKGIAEDPRACILKLLDRCDNVSSMSGVFSTEKCLDYNQETSHYVLPLYRIAKDAMPELSGPLFVLKYHIVSMVSSLDAAFRDKAEPAD